MIIPIKIQCGCGQIYEFDVEPVNGRMPQAVSCPVCCMDGTAVANEIIAQVLATQTQPSPITPSIPSKVKLEKSKAALLIYPSVGVVALVAVAAGLIWWKQRFPTKEQEVNRLEKTMKEAFAEKNPQLFLDQYYWEGTSDKDKQGMSETVSAFVTNGILTKLSFRVSLKIHERCGIKPDGGVECGSWRYRSKLRRWSPWFHNRVPVAAGASTIQKFAPQSNGAARL